MRTIIWATIAAAGVGMSAMTIQGEPPATPAPATTTPVKSELQRLLEIQEISKTVMETVKRLADDFEKEPHNSRPGPDLAVDLRKFCASLASLPNDDPAVIEALALARKWVAMDLPQINTEGLGLKEAKDALRHHHEWRELKQRYSLDVLMGMKVLRPGMNLPDVVAVMGKPNGYGPTAGRPGITSGHWTDVGIALRVRPVLVMTMKDGVVTEFKIQGG